MGIAIYGDDDVLTYMLTTFVRGTNSYMDYLSPLQFSSVQAKGMPVILLQSKFSYFLSAFIV